MLLTTQLRELIGCKVGTSLVVQWLRLCPSTLGATGSIPAWGTKIPYALWCSQKLESKLKKKIVSVTTVIFRNDPRKRETLTYLR